MHQNDAHLLENARHGDRAARDRIVTQHLTEVRAIAVRYRNLGLPVDDLVQEGALGLLDAIDHFDEQRRTEFDVYARFRVRRAIRNALTEKSRLIRLPKEIVERRRALAGAEDRLLQSGGVRPSAAELADATGLNADAVRGARSIVPGVVSLDQPILPDGSTLEAMIEDDASPDPLLDAVEREETQLVDQAVAELPERQREIVCRHFGLGCEREELAAVAADLHLSQQRARTIEREALFTLRNRLECELLPDRPPAGRAGDGSGCGRRDGAGGYRCSRSRASGDGGPRRRRETRRPRSDRSDAHPVALGRPQQ